MNNGFHEERDKKDMTEKEEKDLFYWGKIFRDALGKGKGRTSDKKTGEWRVTDFQMTEEVEERTRATGSRGTKRIEYFWSEGKTGVNQNSSRNCRKAARGSILQALDQRMNSATSTRRFKTSQLYTQD